MATIGGNLLQRPRCWYFRNSLFDCWLKGGDECQARDGENQHHAIFGESPCVAVHPSDPAAALIALDATVRVRGRSRRADLPLAELFAAPTDDRRTETTSARTSCSTSRIAVPPAWRPEHLPEGDGPQGLGVRAGRGGGGGPAGRQPHRGARIVLSGVAPIPWRAEAAERILAGTEGSHEVITQAAEAALEGAQPLAHNGYKVPLAKALVRRALQGLTSGAGHQVTA